MTIGPRIPNLNNVNRIVINRVSVWEKENQILHDQSTDEWGYSNKFIWKKVAGGPGFVQRSSPNRDKTPEQMKSLVGKKLTLTHERKVFENKNTIVFEDKLLYRYWISEETLNIVMRD